MKTCYIFQADIQRVAKQQESEVNDMHYLAMEFAPKSFFCGEYD